MIYMDSQLPETVAMCLDWEETGGIVALMVELIGNVDQVAERMAS